MMKNQYQDFVKDDDRVVRFNRVEKAILLNAISLYTQQIDSLESLESAVYKATCQTLFGKLFNIFVK